MQPAEWFSTIDAAAFRRAVLSWYDRTGRDLPWRRSSDPYHVWVSEVMLQQTTVAAVLGRYERFLRSFPNVVALAAADEGQVLLMWEGLGYYRRARNLHRAAKAVVQDFDGRVPEDPEALRGLPGFGRYTANAVPCFASGRRLPILEANTIRLWTRVAAADGDPARAPLNGRLWDVAEQAMPTRRPGDFNQALMDLGSQVCTARSPNCDACPIRRFCRAYAENATGVYPQLAKKRATEDQTHVAVVLRCGDEVLVVRRPDEGRWAGLWEFPRVERDEGEAWERSVERAVRSAADGSYRLVGERLRIRHGVMHLRIQLVCFDAETDVRLKHDSESSRWLRVEELGGLAFSSPQRRLARHVQATPIQRRLFG